MGDLGMAVRLLSVLTLQSVGIFSAQQCSQQGPLFLVPVALKHMSHPVGPLGIGERGVSDSCPQDQWEHKTWVNP